MSAKNKPAKPAADNNTIAKRLVRRVAPKFERHAHHRKASLKTAWRKPRGLHNKQRDARKQTSPWPQSGYRTPIALRGMHASGLVIAYVVTLKDLETINPQTTGALIGAVGAKKQITLLEAAEKKGIRVLNHKDTKDKIESLKENAKARHAASAKARSHKKSRDEHTKAKKPVDEKLSDEEKKDEENKLKEEVLTAKE